MSKDEFETERNRFRQTQAKSRHEKVGEVDTDKGDVKTDRKQFSADTGDVET